MEKNSTSPEKPNDSAPRFTPDEPSGRDLPTYGAELEALAAAFRALRLDARQRIPGELNGLRQRVELATAKIEAALRYDVPARCPWCDDGCLRCDERGWVRRGSLAGVGQ